MERDFYAILGVSSLADPVEIRASYRALMRIYHPDADRSEEAAALAREINSAYSVLSNPERRAEYDASLAEQRRIRFDPVQANAAGLPRRSFLAPVVAIAITVLAAGMIAFAVSPSMIGLSKSDSMPLEEARPAPLPPEFERTERRQDAGASLCPHPLAPNLIKQELFRLAAEQARDRPLLARAEPLVSARIESVHGEGDAGGCGGWLSLDIPPGMMVEVNRTSLSADLDYTLSRNDEGILQLSSLSGAKNVIRSLATLKAEPGEPGAELAKPTPIATGTAAPPLRPPSAVTPARPAPKQASSDPCAGIAGRSDRMLCQDGNLASLDRQLSSFYRQSWERSDERKRALLADTRQSFNDRRDACGTQSCMTTAYVARLREIGDIMAGRSTP